MSRTPYKVVDLFSGAGGMSIGLEMPERLNGLGNLDYADLGFDEQAFETTQPSNSTMKPPKASA
ncbi:hypothetical protein ACFQMM_02420 [Saliphagus sp. GCM10025308]